MKFETADKLVFFFGITMLLLCAAAAIAMLAFQIWLLMAG